MLTTHADLFQRTGLYFPPIGPLLRAGRPFVLPVLILNKSLNIATGDHAQQRTLSRNVFVHEQYKEALHIPTGVWLRMFFNARR
jgi:hypothetical protein